MIGWPAYSLEHHYRNACWLQSLDDRLAMLHLPCIPIALRHSLVQRPLQFVDFTRAASNVPPPSSTRLGFYYETLWAMVFEANPDTELLERNQQIIVHGQTKGEIDMLIYHIPSGVTYHIEFAIKFFLSHPRLPLLSSVGPSLRDRLDWKLKSLNEKQLSLPKRFPLPKYPHVESIAIVQGRIYQKLVSACCDGWWGTSEDIRTVFGMGVQVYRLPRECWLSRENRRNYSISQTLAYLERQGQASMVAIEMAGRVSHGFWVPKGWEGNAVEFGVVD